jgi:hypothetical protein
MSGLTKSVTALTVDWFLTVAIFFSFGAVFNTGHGIQHPCARGRILHGCFQHQQEMGRTVSFHGIVDDGQHNPFVIFACYFT